MFFKHLKSGGIYEYVGLGVNEIDMKIMVMYRPYMQTTDENGDLVIADTHLLWLRPAHEFFLLFEPYVFLDHASTAEDVEEDEEPNQTIGEALTIKHGQH